MDYDSNRTHKGYSVAVSGGITGLNKGSISGCKSVGAYAFNSNFSSGKYTDSTTKDEEASYSKSPAMSAYSGGISGAVYNGSIFQCSVSDIGETKGTLGAKMYVTASKYDNNRSREVNIWCGGIADASFGNTEIDQCSNSLNPCTGFQVTGKLDLLYENLFCGGILGAANYQNTNITNCYNMGIPTITDDFPNIEHLTNINGGFFHGGLVGAVCNCSLMGNNVIEIHKGAAKVKNCYSIAPSSRFKMDTGDVYSYNYALFNEDTQLSFVTDNATFNNCYYIDSLSGKYGTKKSESEMKSKEFASQLGEAFVYEPDSYPMFSWEKQKVKGDVNSDGYLTVADAVLLQKWLLAVPDTNLQNWQAADLCEDNRLDVFDLVLLKRELINNM